jgi:hypothetical protein
MKDFSKMTIIIIIIIIIIIRSASIIKISGQFTHEKSAPPYWRDPTGALGV